MVYVKEFKPSIFPEFKTSAEVRPAEHEIFLAFNADHDAEVWMNWWHEEGFKSYEQYHKNYENQS